MKSSKPTELMAKHLTKEEKRQRKEVEEVLQGRTDNIKPSSHLTSRQKKIFKYIITELTESKILNNLDIYMLDTVSIAIDRLQYIETTINKDNTLIGDRDLLSAKREYTKDFYKCCLELCLSPQSRSKLAHLNINSLKEKENPVNKVLARKAERNG